MPANVMLAPEQSARASVRLDSDRYNAVRSGELR
jgi:hypothetical protein